MELLEDSRERQVTGVYRSPRTYLEGAYHSYLPLVGKVHLGLDMSVQSTQMM